MKGFSFGSTLAPSGRTSPNWFAMSCGLAYVLCYLFLPFYSIYIHRMPGTEVISSNPIMILPVIMGIVMAISAVLLPVVVSLVLGGVSFVMTLIFALAGQQMIPNLQLLSSGADFLSSLTGSSALSVLRVTVGYGAIFCMVLVIAYFLLELFLGQRSAPVRRDQDSWAFKNKPNGGSGGTYRPF